MADDNNAPPPPAPENNLPPPPPAAPPPADNAAPPPPPPPPAPAPAVPEAVFTRIDRLTKDKRTAEEQAQQLRTRMIAAGLDPDTGLPVAPPPPPANNAPPPAQPPAPTFSPEAIEEAAQRLVAERDFTTRCNTLAAQGTAAHADFPQRMGQLNALGIMNPDLINSAVEIGSAHELLYALAQDLNKATEIGSLPPAQQAIALIKFDNERKAKASESISKAPPPPPGDTQIGAGTPISSTEPLPTDKSADWFKKREAQLGIKDSLVA